MTGIFTAIDLSALPAPKVIEQLDPETILAELKADYTTRWPEFSADIESEPMVKLFEAYAYREYLWRTRINEAAEAVLVARATGTDLDNLGAFFGVSRLDGETDDRFRARIALAPEGYAAAGPIGSYQFHTLKVSTSIKDVSVTQPKPGYVRVTVMSTEGQGVTDAATLAAVRAALNADSVRPLTDVVDVQSVKVLTYSVDADLYLYPGPDSTTVLNAAVAAVTAYVKAQHVIGRDVTKSGLYASLHQTGVQRAEIRSPAADIIVDDLQTAFCLDINVKVAGRAE